MAVALTVSTLLWPVSSIRLLRSEMMVSMEAFRTSVEQTMSIYDRMAKRYDQRLRTRQAKVEEHKSADDAGTAATQLSHSLTIGAQSALQSILEDIQVEDAMLQSLLSASHSVQMSLARQTRLLGESMHEPTTFFYNFPSEAYQRLASTQRRIWCLVLTLEPALRSILEEQVQHQTTHGQQRGGAEELFDVPLFGHDLQLMMPQVMRVLTQCSAGLQSGSLLSRAEMRSMSSRVQQMEGKFASSMNELAQRVRQGKTSMMKSQAIVPLAVFLYSAAQLTEQVLIMEAQVRRLLELERPRGYDD